MKGAENTLMPSFMMKKKKLLFYVTVVKQLFYTIMI